MDKDELLPIKYAEVQEFLQTRDRRAVPKQLVDLRYNMLNKRRYDKRKQIIGERNKLMRA